MSYTADLLILIQSVFWAVCPRFKLKDGNACIHIDGMPPMLYKKPHSCPFAPRCKWVIEKCRMENPPLLPIEEGHRAACWVNIEDREVRDAE